MAILGTFDRRRLLTVAATLAIAFASGVVMERLARRDTPVATVQPGPDAAASVKVGGPRDALPTPPAATLVPLLAPPPILPDRTEESGGTWQDSALTPCVPSLTATAKPAAMIGLHLETCRAGETVRLDHAGLSLTVVTGADGATEATLPALMPAAKVTARADDLALTALAEVPDADDWSRVVLVWTGARVFGLHAYEFGARRNQFGHVWAGSPKSPDRALRRSGGFMTVLEDAEGGADVYSFPSGTSLSGTVRLVAEAPVTRETCGQAATATAFQTGPLSRPGSTSLETVLPGCDETGTIVTLRNLVQDLRLASR